MSTITGPTTGLGVRAPQASSPSHAERLSSLDGLLEVARALQKRLSELGGSKALTSAQVSEIGAFITRARPLERSHCALSSKLTDLNTSFCRDSDVLSRIGGAVTNFRISLTEARLLALVRSATGLLGPAIQNAIALNAIAKSPAHSELEGAKSARPRAVQYLEEAFSSIVGCKPGDSDFSACVMERLFPAKGPAPALGPDRDDGLDDAYGPGMYGRGD